MELELNTIHESCYDTILDTTLFSEETMESIVPDACPDILRIADTEATCCLKSKEVLEGRVEICGTVRADILYCPDGEAGVRRMSVIIPFRSTAEVVGASGQCRIVAVPRIQAVDARSLNPRKVLVRVNLAIETQVLSPQANPICDRAECPTESGIQQRSETQTTSMITAVEEKPFTFSDDLTLSGSKPPIEELLKTRVTLTSNESKIIGNKLIFKGQANLQLFYRDRSAALCTADFELPFSQILEVTGVEEDAECTLLILLTECTCTLSDAGADEGRTISVSLGMLAQATVRETRRVTLLSDAYSTLFALTAERRPHTFYHKTEQSVHRVMLREVLETQAPARVVHDVHVNMGSLRQERAGEMVTLHAETAVTVVYQDESGAVCSITRSLPATCDVPLPEGCVCSCRHICPGDCSATPTGEGIEVRYPVDFSILALTPHRASGIFALHLDEAAPRNTATQPSIVLRLVGDGEGLWDLAKAYGTTTEEIVRANALAEETLPTGQLLLIPKKR